MKDNWRFGITRDTFTDRYEVRVYPPAYFYVGFASKEGVLDNPERLEFLKEKLRGELVLEILRDPFIAEEVSRREQIAYAKGRVDGEKVPVFRH